MRLSLTDRCDLACVYCRPHRHDGYVDERLDLSAWKTVILALFDRGIERFRLTGGEPLLSPLVGPVVSLLAERGARDIALTTNATLLERHARALRERGLHRVNISLDTLDGRRFFAMTRGGQLDRVLRGIDAALEAGFAEIKLNMVVVRGQNDDEIASMVDFAWARGITPRLLEVMAIGEGATLSDRIVTVREMRERLAERLEPAPPSRDPDRGPAAYVFKKGDPHARVGFISGMSDTFCEGCDRLRVSSDGMARPCLAKAEGVSIASHARQGREDSVGDGIDRAWDQKPDGSSFRGCTEPSARKVSIRAIGG